MNEPCPIGNGEGWLWLLPVGPRWKQMDISRPASHSLDTARGGWFEAWGASIEKPSNEMLTAHDGTFVARSNEDRFRLDRTAANGLVVGVADGAGGEGLYCGCWADELLNRLPAVPIETNGELNEWLGSFWEQFRQKFKERAKPTPFLYRKFVKEGSFATLSSVWLKPSHAARYLARYYMVIAHYFSGAGPPVNPRFSFSIRKK